MIKVSLVTRHVAAAAAAATAAAAGCVHQCTDLNQLGVATTTAADRIRLST